MRFLTVCGQPGGRVRAQAGLWHDTQKLCSPPPVSTTSPSPPLFLPHAHLSPRRSTLRPACSYARSQRAQAVGQAVGLPLFQAAFCFAGLAVTSATVVMYGHPISDPIALLSKVGSSSQGGWASGVVGGHSMHQLQAAAQVGGWPAALTRSWATPCCPPLQVKGAWAIAGALVGLVLATLTTNIAANVVAPANAFVALAPSRFRCAFVAESTHGAALVSPTCVENTAHPCRWLARLEAVLTHPASPSPPHTLQLCRRRGADERAGPGVPPLGPHLLHLLILGLAGGWVVGRSKAVQRQSGCEGLSPPPPPARWAYSVCLGPCAGILCADYFLLRHRQLDVDALYSSSLTSPYHYRGGWNPAALAALAAGALPVLPGLLHSLCGTPAPPLLVTAYQQAAWPIGFFAAGAAYLLLMRRGYWLRPQEALVGRAAA